MSNLSIRRAKISDIPSIHSIEKKSFERPWSFTSFLFELKNPFSFFYVLEKDEKIAGYFIIWDMGEEFHLANIAVHPEERGKGYARSILEHIVEMAKKENKKKIRLEVRVSNKRAISIYEKFGFEKNGIIKGYYGNEDGIEFVYRLKGKL